MSNIQYTLLLCLPCHIALINTIEQILNRFMMLNYFTETVSLKRSIFLFFVMQNGICVCYEKKEKTEKHIRKLKHLT